MPERYLEIHAFHLIHINYFESEHFEPSGETVALYCYLFDQRLQKLAGFLLQDRKRTGFDKRKSMQTFVHFQTSDEYTAYSTLT